MGNILQIRVMAKTVSTSEVGWNWRKLCLLTFGKQPTDADKDMGVFELIDALVDTFRFGNMDSELKKTIKPGLEKVADLRNQLEEALADWNPGKANSLSVELEDALDALEAATPDPKLK